MPRAASRTVKSADKGPLVFNGKPLVPNDHIYVSAPWDDREGEPYLIARVLEVVQPTPKSQLPAALAGKPSSSSGRTSSASSSSAGKSTARAETPSGKETSAGRVVVSAHELRVRVAYYFRTRDITNRYVADHRLLVAAMHADTVPASYVRGLCTVRHRDHIEELDVYKREKDTFYWHQLYDRYLHRYFDALPTYKVQNAPADVLKHLQDGFEFVLCEVGTGSELCDAQRGCSVCCKWAAFADSVTCARCSKVFHLGCVDPPLAAKPKAGYGWSCAPCNKAYEDEVEEFAESGFRPGPPARKPGGVSGYITAPGGSQMLHASKKGKAREVAPTARVDPHDWRMTNGWPFRYFGMHAHAYNVMDPHDSLHPRASTRLGNKFQCSVPDWDPVANRQQAQPEPRQYFQPKRSRASTPIAKGDRDKARRAKLVEAPPRGEDEAVNIIWRPTDKYSEESLAELFERVRKMAMYTTAGVDTLNRALMLFAAKEGNVTETILALRKVSLGSLSHVSWNEEDRKKLADGAQQHHNDIGEIAKLLPNKKMGDVVKRYYVQVGHTLQEDEPTQPEEKATAVAARSKKTARRKARAAEDAEAESDGDNSDHGSVAPPAKTPAQRKNRFCGICSTTDTPKWYWCPNNISELEVKPNPLVMCETCGMRWRHYGAQYPPYGDEIKPLPDRKKKAKAASDDGKKEASSATPVPTPAPVVKEPTPPPPKPVIIPKPCLLCKRFEPKTALFQCNKCTVSYHASCFGIDLDWDWPHEEWLCHMCERDQERKPLCLHPFCVLCPTPKNIELAQPMTALDCMKETELSNYVHLLCAVWHRELQLGAPAIVSPVEGFTLLPTYRQQTTCALCKQKNVGTTIKCEDCPKQVHVACAWNAGFKFAFEVQPVRNKKRPPKDAVTVKFKEAEGILQPCVWCPDHHFTHAERKTYDLGARDQASKLMYVRTYKGVKFPEAPLLLRQGRRLEAVLQPAVKPKAPSPAPSAAPRARVGRGSLLATVIDEGGVIQDAAARPAKKRRTASATPVASPAPRPARPPKASTPVTPLTIELVHPASEPLSKRISAPTPTKATFAAPEPELPVEDDSTKVALAMDTSREASVEQESFATNSIVSTSRRARVPKPPKHFSPPPPLPKKVLKKRKSRVSSTFESTPLTPLENGFNDGQQHSTVAHIDPALEKVAPMTFLSTNGNLDLPQSKASLPLPELSSLTTLPKLPDFADMKSPHYSAAVSAPHMLEPLVYTAHTPAPALAAPASHVEPQVEPQVEPAAPDASETRHALDPALEALSAMAAAAAESRDAEASAAREAANQPVDTTRRTPTEQETINAFAALVGMPPRPTSQQADAAAPAVTNGETAEATAAATSNGVQQSTSSPTQAQDSEATPAKASNASPGEAETSETPSGRPKRKTRAPAALRETTAYADSAQLPEIARLGQNSPRPQSPAHLEPIHAHPILDYVRAHESAQQSFRVDTPDDSDVASERFDSPAPPNLSPISSMAPFGRMLLGSPLANVNTLPIPPSADALPPLPAMPPTPHALSPARPPAQKRKKSNSVSNGGPPITCANCGTSDSPLFRRDSEGRQLCNSCGLYFKTHGRDRPQKVIARAIGATRMQKRKAQADQEGGGGSPSSGNGGKRAKKSGTPLPLRSLPPLLPHAPSHPSPLQPMPAFAYGDFVPYAHNGSYAGAVASGSGERPSTSRSSSGGGSALDGTLSGGYGSEYNPPYGYGAGASGMNGQQPGPFDARAFGGQLPPLPPHLQQHHQHHQPSYPPAYPSAPSQIGRVSRVDASTADYAAATPPEDVYYDQARSGGRAVDAEILQRHALESLAAQALTFGAAGPGPAALAQARSSETTPAIHASLVGEASRPTTSEGMGSSGSVPRAADALASMNPATRIQAHDALEQRGQPSPPPSASAMPLGELFPGFSGPNAQSAAAQANGASDADDETA
ncbi:hypothetical protein JCM10908_004638 [Rhodotorula pacifica]|uniref:uncharacterized protein n=1 Tax=Rhodotorula pacifica TaxID=1495444 RepID=UPI00317B4339